MFESITKSLGSVLDKLKARGKLTEANIKEAMREVRTALLEADVNYKVAKDFIKSVTAKAVGTEVLESIKPGQQVVKIVHDELVELMGGTETVRFRWNPGRPTVILLAGLQGAGKTTFAGKLARHLVKRSGRHPLLVAADVQRPAAVEQLKVLGKQLDVPVYAEEGGRPPRICKRALKEAAKTGRDTVILDTAGRLHIDRELMDEVKDIARRVDPDEVLLVCDSMTGQDAVNSAKEFNEQLELTGVVLTKLDGDARGGAALSVKAVTGKPIRFVGVGEKLDALEEFHPDRMAGRILGMGDIVSLVEQAQENIEQEKAEEMAEKMFTATFTLDDFLEQFAMLEKMGNLKDLVAKIPGIGAQMGDVELDEGELRHMKAIIQSMTPRERYHPDMIDGQRRRRIARGSGTSVGEVNELLKQFKQTRKMFKDMGKQGGGFMQKIAGRRMRKSKKKKWDQLKGSKKKPFDMTRFLRGE
jgi:signal recognition particle subunit SRP54